MPLWMSTVDVQAWDGRLVDMRTPNVLTHVYLRSTKDVQAWDDSLFILGAFVSLELGGTVFNGRSSIGFAIRFKSIVHIH